MDPRVITYRLFAPTTALKLAAAAACLSSCSAFGIDRVDCTEDVQCEELVGAGATCLQSGFCAASSGATENSCETTRDCQSASGFGLSCAQNECVPPPALGGCDRTVPGNLLENRSANTERIVFGVLLDERVTADVDRGRAIELATSHINEGGGVDGRSVGLVFCNTGGLAGTSRPDAAVEMATWLVGDVGVAGLLGPSEAGDSELVFVEVVNSTQFRDQVLLITPSASDPALTQRDVADATNGAATDATPGTLWRTAPSGVDQVELVIADMESRGITSVAIIRELSPFAGTSIPQGQGYAQTFESLWAQASEQYTYTGGNESARDQAVREAAPGAAINTAMLFVGPTSDARAFLREASRLTAEYPEGLPIYFFDTGALDEVFDDANSTRLFTSVFASRPSVPALEDAAHPTASAYSNFAAEFEARFGTDPSRSSYTASAYDAAWFMAAAAAWAAFQGAETDTDTVSGYPRFSASDMARGLRKMASGLGLEFTPANWTNLVSQFRAGREIDAIGSASSYNFDLATEEAPADRPPELVQGTQSGTFGPLTVPEE